MNIYERNILKYKAAVGALTNSSNRLSAFRLISFVAAVILIVIMLAGGLAGGILIVVPIFIIGFGFLVQRHNQIDNTTKYNTALKEINQDELLRIQSDLSRFPTGQAFNDPNHPYLSDLDIFGKHSIFQLINRTSTESGAALLADWLSGPAPDEVILKRQRAVQELSARLEWRQEFQASGIVYGHATGDYERLLNWMRIPSKALTHKTKYLSVIIPLSLLSSGALAYFVYQFLFLGNLFGSFPLIIVMLVNSTVLKQAVGKVVVETTKNISQNIILLRGFRSLILKVEREKFNSEILRACQRVFVHDNPPASSKIGSLNKILEVFQLRGAKHEFNNPFYSIFNGLWFIDVYLLLLTEKWREINGPSFEAWSSAVSEFEALSSIAGFHYANTSFVFPEITREGSMIRLEKVGHPLINFQGRISNNFSLKDRGEIAIITGSNMAGKSTFLRTIGVNIVLGLMGAPCCASVAQLSNVRVFSSMRTHDSLYEGVSSFYAELKKVEQLLALTSSGYPTFFLLDEMFKGTNSKDRRTGAFSLIKQLKDLGASGIVSTHDLDFAAFAEEVMVVANYSFNSKLHNDDLVFDYKLVDGLCSDFHASALMKKSGIRIISDKSR